MSDRLLDRLAALPAAAPSAERASQVRARCHRALARRRRSARAPWQRAVQYWPHVVAGLGGLYLTEMVRQLLEVWERR